MITLIVYKGLALISFYIIETTACWLYYARAATSNYHIGLTRRRNCCFYEFILDYRFILLLFLLFSYRETECSAEYNVGNKFKAKFDYLIV